jgi:murein DD-endopeptidase MepM/ murein hydrolase activator NlpD
MYMRKFRNVHLTLVKLFPFIALCVACSATPVPGTEPDATLQAPSIAQTSLPTRSAHPPGELLDYQAVSGDTLLALAVRFNTSIEEIRQANPQLPALVTTLPPGYALLIPAYYLPFTGTPFQILPDSEFINGPTAIGFDVEDELRSKPGYLSDTSDYAYRLERPAWEVIQVIADNYSIHPRLLLTLLEYLTQAVTNPFPSEEEQTYPLGNDDPRYQGLFRQLLWASERLSDGFYGWRSGKMRSFETLDGLVVVPDSYQNAGTVALQYLFAGVNTLEGLEHIIGPAGFQATFIQLWGDPYAYADDQIPGSLQQPELTLPFVPERIWDFTGGPHFAWGTSLPLGALDFAPPSMQGGCVWSSEWVTAPADGLIVRSEEAIVELDLDQDGDARTGWVIFFYHVATEGRVSEGVQVEVGDLIAHPSCEGGRATGTHVHMARKFNGEWIEADGPIPFDLGGWTAREGDEPYLGTLERGSNVVEACTCSTSENRIIYELPGS